MRSEIDALMLDRELVALLIPIDHHYSPYVDMLVGRARMTHGLLLKRHRADPLLIAQGMEVEEARATGAAVLTQTDLGWPAIQKQYGTDQIGAEAALWQAALAQAKVPPGRVGIYGVGELGEILALLPRLNTPDSPYVFVGEGGRNLFDVAAVTKADDEIARIESVAQRTNEVMAATWDYISGHQAVDGVVRQPDGTPLTVGDVKRFVLAALLQRGLEDTEMIFAQGRDAAFPHSRGTEHMALQTGQTIVFDLFPREAGGGYHHDMTRTWCLGHASEAAQSIYDQVMHAFDIALQAFALDKPTHLMDEAVLDYFEGAGHATGRSQPGTDHGYVHSLGHGLGLKVHELPSISFRRKDDRFQVGNVITIEPGLYDPTAGLGVRVEDTLVIDADGSLRSLTPFRKDLVLPLLG